MEHIIINKALCALVQLFVVGIVEGLIGRGGEGLVKGGGGIIYVPRRTSVQ